jgi:hypothetical protein
VSPRIEADGLRLDRHGAIDHRQMERPSVTAASDAHSTALAELGRVPAAVCELVRLRNADKQRCRL